MQVDIPLVLDLAPYKQNKGLFCLYGAKSSTSGISTCMTPACEGQGG